MNAVSSIVSRNTITKRNIQTIGAAGHVTVNGVNPMLDDFLNGELSIKITEDDLDKCKELQDVLNKTFHSGDSLFGHTMKSYIEHLNVIWIYSDESNYDKPGHVNSIYYNEEEYKTSVTVDEFLACYNTVDFEMEDNEFDNMFGE